MPSVPPEEVEILDGDGHENVEKPEVSAVSKALANLLDDIITIPGTDIGVGLDALIGLFPGIGDAAGTILSGVILVEAVRNRVPLPVLLRMAANLLIDTGLGAVPAVGDVADVAHRANRKNHRLLQKAVEEGDQVTETTSGYLIRAVLIVVAILTLMMIVAGLAIYGIIKLLGAL